jgi:hypothetical protein
MTPPVHRKSSTGRSIGTGGTADLVGPAGNGRLPRGAQADPAAGGNGGPRGVRGGPTPGTVTSVWGDVITMTTSGGTEVTVTATATTTYTRSQASSPDGLVAGRTMHITGTAEAGVITADAIEA